MENPEYMDTHGELGGEVSEEYTAEPRSYAEAYDAPDIAEPSVSLTRAPSISPAVYGNMSARAMRRLEERKTEDAVNARIAAILSAELMNNVTTLVALGEQMARNTPGAKKHIDIITTSYALYHSRAQAERWTR
jgi:hypothetical protein